MPERCPHCGAEMQEDTIDHAHRSYDVLRCADCPYYTEVTEQPDGTIIAIAHAPNVPEAPDSCEGEG